MKALIYTMKEMNTRTRIAHGWVDGWANKKVIADRQVCEDFCKKNDWQIVATVTEGDKSRSILGPKPPMGMLNVYKLSQFIKDNQIDVVVVADLETIALYLSLFSLLHKALWHNKAKLAEALSGKIVDQKELDIWHTRSWKRIMPNMKADKQIQAIQDELEDEWDKIKEESSVFTEGIWDEKADVSIVSPSQ